MLSHLVTSTGKQCIRVSVQVIASVYSVCVAVCIHYLAVITLSSIQVEIQVQLEIQVGGGGGDGGEC